MKQPNITVVGSLNMDLVVSVNRMPKQGETMHGSSIHYVPGGKGANQAVGCAKLGAATTMLGAVGDDRFGDHILSDMAKYGLPVAPIARHAGVPTGTATILHSPEDNCIVIVAGANGKVDPSYVDAHAELIRGSDAVLLQLEIPLDAMERALRIARESGVITILNPAPAQQLPESLLKLVSVLTPNETEFELLSQCPVHCSDEELLQAMLAWEGNYGHRLVVTRGKHGVSYVNNDQLVTVPAPAVSVVDTTGAGDCFNAALCYGLASSWPWEDAVQFAVKAASLSVTRFGAQEGMPYMQELTAV